MNKDQIQNEAKQILDKFSKSLSKVKFSPKKVKDPLSGMREEGPGQETDEEFRSQFFKNAPQTREDFILAEKKQW